MHFCKQSSKQKARVNDPGFPFGKLPWSITPVQMGDRAPGTNNIMLLRHKGGVLCIGFALCVLPGSLLSGSLSFFCCL